MTTQGDPLLALRRSIALARPPITTLPPPPSSTSPSTPGPTEPDVSLATHLHFAYSSQLFPLSLPTRFVVNDSPIDLRSIYFAWLKKDVGTVDYAGACRALTEDLNRKNPDNSDELEEGRPGGTVRNLLFAEKVELNAWLDGAGEGSEFIQPLSEEARKQQEEADKAAAQAAGSQAGQRPVGVGGASGAGKVVDPKLKEIYNQERRMGDRNSVLRGIKPTDFSHIRKHAELFLGRNNTSKTNRPNGIPQKPTSVVPSRTKIPSTPSGNPPPRSREPIILLSPSASSLLRMSNIKTFLDGGIYQPADSATSTAANILHIPRLLPSIDPVRPLRFILVDSADQFKPDYWSRVVAVFTTGQLWQFKGYLWQNPPELFSRALGIYVGWRGEEVPSSVKGWGRGVMSCQIDKFNEVQGSQGRWRDREVVEGIWTAVEGSMRAKGWGKEVGR